MADNVTAELSSMAAKTRVFVSMPYIPGLTPRFMAEGDGLETVDCGEPVERRHGIFEVDQVGVSPLDHGVLYGDGCFEGILIINDRIFLFKEHLARWYESARRLGISLPYGMDELATVIQRTVQAVGFDKGEKGYLRPVLTRGLGNLGINPAKCVAPTLFVIASTIQLYPPEAYETGISLSLARNIRRAGRTVVDPNIKSCNYLNNISGLLETRGEGTLETLLMTDEGFVAEASADNIFLVTAEEGWEEDPSLVTVSTPCDQYCLVGITRNLILREAISLGFSVEEREDLTPMDLVGADREVFMTGTGCGVMPVIGIAGLGVGDGTPGPVTKKLLERIRAAMADPDHGLAVDADEGALESYIETPFQVRVN